MSTILFTFLWKQFMPDMRAYKPSSPIIETNVVVGVDVPLTKDLINNAEEVIKWRVSSSNVDEPHAILTPLGMRYIIDQFEAVMMNTTTQNEDTSEDEWEDEETTTDEANDEWEDLSTDSTNKNDDEWDNSWEE